MCSNQDDRLFEDAVKILGETRLSDNAFSTERFGSILDQARSQAIQRIQTFLSGGMLVRDMSPIILDYIDYPKLNAFAFDYAGNHFIALSGYGIVVVYYTMLRMLSNPNFLVEIGNSKKENKDTPFIPLSDDFRIIFNHLVNSNITLSSFLPKDEIRELTARAVAQLATDFIIAHEFRHHQAGHVRYFQEQHRQPFIRELSIEINEPSLSIVSQALEMDADSYAIKTILDWSLKIVAQPEKYSESWAMVFTNAKQTAYLCMLSAYIVFKLLDFVGNSPDSWENISHPPPALRASMMLATALECFKSWNRSDLYDWLPECLPRIIEVGEKQLGLIANIKPKKDLLMRIYGAEGQNHVSSILETWSKIEAQLSAYSFVSF